VTLHVLLFASAREAAGGVERLALELPGEEAGASAVMEEIARRGGELARIASRARLAVNRRFAGPDTTVGVEDELALIPPVGGG